MNELTAGLHKPGRSTCVDVCGSLWVETAGRSVDSVVRTSCLVAASALGTDR
jgi:hypothetical protein